MSLGHRNLTIQSLDAWFDTGFTRKRKGHFARKGESNMSRTINLLSPPWLAIRAQLRSALDARAEYRSLERDLAVYTSENDLNEMEAILDRHDDTHTGDLRSILSAQRLRNETAR
jgi:hypothetical protein